VETKHVTDLMPEINKTHHIQIKNTHYACIYLTCALYFFNKVIFFSIYYLLKNEVWGIQENTTYFPLTQQILCIFYSATCLNASGMIIMMDG
jgi:hypothetical protein